MNRAVILHSLMNRTVILRSLMNRAVILHSLANRAVILHSLINRAVILHSLMTRAVILHRLMNRAVILHSLMNRAVILHSLMNRAVILDSLMNRAVILHSLMNRAVKSCCRYGETALAESRGYREYKLHNQPYELKLRFGYICLLLFLIILPPIRNTLPCTFTGLAEPVWIKIMIVSRWSCAGLVCSGQRVH